MTAWKRAQRKFSTRRCRAKNRKAQLKARRQVALFNQQLSGEGGIL